MMADPRNHEARQTEAAEKMAEELNLIRLQLLNLNSNIAAIMRQMAAPRR